MPLALVSPVLATLASVVAAQSLPTNSTPRLPLALAKPYVESYWESWSAWQDFPGDYAAFLKDVPATPIGSCQENWTSHITLDPTYFYQQFTQHRTKNEIVGQQGVEMTSVQGVNVINIAFGDYSEGISGHETTEEIIKEGVRAIHDKVSSFSLSVSTQMWEPPDARAAM